MTRRAQTLALCVFIDALGWELLQRYPFLDDELAVKAPLQTVFGYSSTCDPTILTGTLPRQHGHFSFFVYDPDRSPFDPRLCRALGRLPRALTDRGRVRHRLSQLWQRRLGYTGYFQLYRVPFARLPDLDYTEKRDLYQPGGIRGGQATIFDDLRRAEIPFFCSDWRRSETQCLAALTDALERDRPRLAYLYLAAMDALLHARGTRAAAVAGKIQWYESALRRLLSQARRLYPEVRLHIFSDHGMTDVVSVCDVLGAIEGLGLAWGDDYGAVYDSTMARFWLRSDRAREVIPAALARLPQGRIVGDDVLERWGCDFPDRRYGDLFFVLDPGVLLCPGFLGDSPLAGMHGYDPDHPSSIASFATSAPSGHALPRHLTDLYGWMRQEAGLPSDKGMLPAAA